MWSLFRLLFSANYWRTLARSETWRASGVSLRRAHKDKRARKQLWGMLLLLLTPFLCVAYLGWIVASGFGIIGAVIALIMFGAVAAYRSRRPVEKDGPLTLSLSEPQPVAEKTVPPPGPELRQEFAELALLHAVLADRAGSEIFVKTKILPEGVEVITRRRHLEILRAHGLYERLGDIERDLLLMPDGHWEPHMIDVVSMALEPLRLLRWVLRVDAFLPTVASALRANYKMASTTLNEPEALFEGQKLIDMGDLRTGITAAEQYFYRCYAEGVHRGYFSPDDEQEAAQAKEYAARMEGKEGEDFLLGTTIVSSASESDVRLGTTLGLRRAQVLRWVQQGIYGESKRSDSDRLEAFYIR